MLITVRDLGPRHFPFLIILDASPSRWQESLAQSRGRRRLLFESSDLCQAHDRPGNYLCLGLPGMLLSSVSIMVECCGGLPLCLTNEMLFHLDGSKKSRLAFAAGDKGGTQGCHLHPLLLNKWEYGTYVRKGGWGSDTSKVLVAEYNSP